MVCKKYNVFDISLSRHTTLKPLKFGIIDEIKSTARIGLCEFVYEKNSIPLFDKQKHIDYIVESSISVIQRLIQICSDSVIRRSAIINISTGTHDLFSLYITLILSLMILTNLSVSYLEDFQQLNQLKFAE
ncbi:unnamed protein product [Didymodactylos carnosus]|uniref:Uncharacterized protein n=1 Tax=Didymodactylos carnosus TaxID=1234261 RepID=A0A814WRZ4_9BILA|nr:unnamed protein product [Didymodactylos carnosus]CAF3969687.1 unnamed protein product [Didymodactylos carnosus]